MSSFRIILKRSDCTMSKQLILNPVENLPNLITRKSYEDIQGLYVSDKLKTDEIVKSSIIGFSGRGKQNEDVRRIYSEWKELIGVQNLSMRLLSGLHAHTVLFMGLGNIGDKVMILPIEAGGHFSTKIILERLGYNVIEAIPDNTNLAIDFEKTLSIIKKEKPKFVFIDRSEGIYYEDFTELINNITEDCGTMFDASQYLTNIMMSDFKSPFDMGFHLMMSTLHKNFPGPQKAMVCSPNDNIYWEKALYAMNNYVSNIHVEPIYLAGDILSQKVLLSNYSEKMLQNSIQLESHMNDLGLPVVLKCKNRTPTHHIWLNFNNKDVAFDFYKKMEKCGLLVNYRKLPYDLGFGIRMGTAAATLQGINESNQTDLADLIFRIYKADLVDSKIISDCQDFISSLLPLSQTIGDNYG